MAPARTVDYLIMHSFLSEPASVGTQRKPIIHHNLLARPDGMQFERVNYVADEARRPVRCGHFLISNCESITAPRVCSIRVTDECSLVVVRKRVSIHRYRKTQKPNRLVSTKSLRAGKIEYNMNSPQNYHDLVLNRTAASRTEISS
jgi:hypothetical protein